MNATVVSSARSDVGKVRKVNEDSLVATAPVFLVADGMGGHARGDAASQTAVRVFTERLIASANEAEPLDVDTVLAGVHAANTEVRSLSGEDEFGAAVAGTTLAGVVQVTDAGHPAWMIVNVGDSRVYGWDGRTLSQLTVDHSAVQELLDAGLIGLDEVAEHPDRNIITRALGADHEVEIDFWVIPAEGTQNFVVCTDGLCKELDDEQIARILAETAVEGGAGRSIADALVDAAVAAGGRDNVSVIVVESRAGR